MLNRKTSAMHHDDPHSWDVIIPRRAQTTDITIHDGNFITDNRRETKVYHDNRQTAYDSYESTVFNAPVQGYVRSAKNGGAVNAFVQITNVVSQRSSPEIGLDENPPPMRAVSSQINTADRTISPEVTQMTNSAVGESGSSAPTASDPNLEQELHRLSPNMQAFLRSLQERKEQAEPVKRCLGRGHTM